MTFPRWFRHVFRTLLHLGADAGAIVLAFWLAYQLRFHSEWFTNFFPVRGRDPGWHLYSRMLYAVTPMWLSIFWYASRLYLRVWHSPFDRAIQIAKGAVLGTIATLAATYVYQRLAYSRLMIISAAPLAVVTIAFGHWLVSVVDEWLAQYEKVSPMLLIGGGKVSELVKENVHERHPRVPIHEFKNIPSPEKLLEYVERENAGEIVLVRSDVDHGQLLALAETCESVGLNFRMIPDLLELRLGEIQMDESLGLPAYRLQHTQLTRANYLSKRIFDTIFVLLVFAILGLPLLAIALLIRLDSRGPALFKQKRLGFRGQVFEAYKFRTMVANAEKQVKAVKDSKNDQKGGFFKLKNDPRITRVGRWLRRYSLDEFPQFINVLRGEMSIVGPRPLAVTTGEMDELIEEFGPTAKKRVNTLPGVTGLWQVSGRSDISSSQRFALDMFYIEHWSLGLDLEIILKTVPAMISGKGGLLMKAAVKIPWLDLKRQYAVLREELLEASQRVLDSGIFILGPEVKAFEEEFARAHEAQRCVGISSGTQALQVGLRALGVGPGDEVAVPAFTFVATATEVAAVGARPVFVDVDPERLTLDPKDLARRITPKTKAIVPVHLYGGPADMDPIMDIAKEKGIGVLEDCAQSHLARYKGRSIGTIGNFGAFSFYPSKNLGALGDAGALLVRDADQEAQVRMLGNCGREPGKQYSYGIIGYNYRLDALQAAFLRVKLRRLSQWTRRRREIADKYFKAFAGLPLGLPPADTGGTEHAFHQFVVRSPKRDAILAHLSKSGIGAGIYYPEPLHLQKAFAHLATDALPEAERAAKEVLALPMFPELTDGEVATVADTVREAVLR